MLTIEKLIKEMEDSIETSRKLTERLRVLVGSVGSSGPKLTGDVTGVEPKYTGAAARVEHTRSTGDVTEVSQPELALWKKVLKHIIITQALNEIMVREVGAVVDRSDVSNEVYGEMVQLNRAFKRPVILTRFGVTELIVDLKGGESAEERAVIEAEGEADDELAEGDK
jgi:hypothetical protein